MQVASKSAFRFLLSAILAVAFIVILACPKAALADPAKTWYPGGGATAGYLTNRMIGGSPAPGPNEGGINTDYFTTTPGEYCNYYNLGDYLTSPNPNNISNITGLDPDPTGINRQGYQIGDNASNVCQAKGDTWGFSVTGNLTNSCRLGYVCGMHRFVRLSDTTPTSPWSDSLKSSDGLGVEPALTFTENVNPTAAWIPYGGGFGYFCPLLQDTVSTHYLEYCFVEWRQGGGFPLAPYETVSAANHQCQNTEPQENNIDVFFTQFANNTTWSVQNPLSASTFTFTSTGNRYFTASITKGDLTRAIAAVNSVCTGHNFSTDTRNYKLVGFEHGTEGGGFGTIGESVSGDRIYTTTNALYAGDTLPGGQIMHSSYNNYSMTMQQNGDLVIKNGGGTPIWHSNTSSTDSATYWLTLQASDGNLVIYKQLTGQQNVQAIWNTGVSHANPYSFYATLKDDGTLTEYNGNASQWSSAQHCCNVP